MERDNDGQVIIHTGFDGDLMDLCAICGEQAGYHYTTWDGAYSGCDGTECQGFAPIRNDQDDDQDDLDAEPEEWVTDHPDFPRGTRVRYPVTVDGGDFDMVHHILATRDGWAKIQMVEDDYVREVELSELTLEETD